MSSRRSFIVSICDLSEKVHIYPQSEDPMGAVRRIGKVAGLVRIGVNLQRLSQGSGSAGGASPPCRAFDGGSFASYSLAALLLLAAPMIPSW
jgi:hypothetical protein